MVFSFLFYFLLLSFFNFFSLVVIEGMKGGTRRLGGRKDPTLFGLVLFNQKIYVQLISLVMFFSPNRRKWSGKEYSSPIVQSSEPCCA